MLLRYQVIASLPRLPDLSLALTEEAVIDAEKSVLTIGHAADQGRLFQLAYRFVLPFHTIFRPLNTFAPGVLRSPDLVWESG
jgi:hypothetical protein